MLLLNRFSIPCSTRLTQLHEKEQLLSIHASQLQSHSGQFVAYRKKHQQELKKLLVIVSFRQKKFVLNA